MKKFIVYIPVLALAILTACSNKKAYDPASGRIYGEKSGIITFKTLDMMGVKVTQIVYFDDYGYKEAREVITSGSMMGMEVNSRSMSIREGNTAYYFDIENIQNGQNSVKKEAYKSLIPGDMMMQMDMAGLSDDFKKKHEYKEEGTETILGYKGLKYSLVAEEGGDGMRITGVHYKNIPLKISLANMDMVAEKIELNVKIPAEKFKIPEGYQIVDESDSSFMEEGEMGDTTKDSE